MLEIRFARIEWTTDGEITTTEDLVPPCKLLSYVPQGPGERRPTQINERLSLVLRRDAPTWLRILNATFARARYWAEEQKFRRDMRTVLLIRDDNRHDADTWFEAPLYDGRVNFRDSQGRVLDLSITRGPYWKGPETALQVMNTGTSLAWANTATIYNHDDDMPGHNNWVLVEAPAGDVPTPARLLVHNTYDSGRRLRRIYAGWYNRPQQLTLDVADADGATLFPDDTDYSYDKRGSGTTFTWDVDNDVFLDYTGMFKVLANGDLSAGNWRVAVGYVMTRLQQNARVPGADGWTDLGNVMLPPGPYSHPTRYPMKVWLEGTASGMLDFLLFIPVSWDTQLRQLIFQGYNAVNGTCVEDDGVNDELVYQFGDQRLPILYSFGQPIFLQPETMLPQALDPSSSVPNAQMLSFALENDVGGAEALRTAEIAVYARPWYELLP
jgi:hypothetical protein